MDHLLQRICIFSLSVIGRWKALSSVERIPSIRSKWQRRLFWTRGGRARPLSCNFGWLSPQELRIGERKRKDELLMQKTPSQPHWKQSNNGFLYLPAWSCKRPSPIPPVFYSFSRSLHPLFKDRKHRSNSFSYTHTEKTQTEQLRLRTHTTHTLWSGGRPTWLNRMTVSLDGALIWTRKKINRSQIIGCPLCKTGSLPSPR